MALPKSPCLISTPQSDLFPALMGLPELDRVGTREEKVPLCLWRFPVFGFRRQTLAPAPRPPDAAFPLLWRRIWVVSLELWRDLA